MLVLKLGSVSMLVILLGNGFHSEIVLGTKECKKENIRSQTLAQLPSLAACLTVLQAMGSGLGTRLGKHSFRV